MTGNKQLRVSATTPVVAAAAALATVLSGCSLMAETPSQQADGSGDVRAALVASGESTEIADCILRLASSEIERNTYNDVLEGEMRNACLAAQQTVGDRGGELSPHRQDSDALAYVDDRQDYGDDRVLDALWDDCKGGSGSACDELFNSSPIDSAYEQFGLSCGQRPDVASCEDLDTDQSNPDPSTTPSDDDTTRP